MSRYRFVALLVVCSSWRVVQRRSPSHSRRHSRPATRRLSADSWPTLNRRRQPLLTPDHRAATALPEMPIRRPRAYSVGRRQRWTGAYPAPVDAGATSGDVIQAADGVIAPGEYAHQVTIGQVTLYWSNDAEYLYLAAEAQTSGWLGVGLDPKSQMKGADFVIAAADGDGCCRCTDAYGQAPTGATHPQDDDDRWIRRSGGLRRIAAGWLGAAGSAEAAGLGRRRMIGRCSPARPTR